MDMDIEGWELLPNDGLFDYHEDADKTVYFSDPNKNKQHGYPYPKTVFNMNYFKIVETPIDSKAISNSNPNSKSSQVVPLPFELETEVGKGKIIDEEEVAVVKEITKVPIEIRRIVPAPPAISQSEKGEGDQDAVSQVFFKKMKENEFVDMKMDSPKSGSRGILPQIEVGSFQFDDKTEAAIMEDKSSPRMMTKGNSDVKEVITWEEHGGGFNIWRWRFTGIGALCSFGFAAATICILIFGSRQTNKQNQQNQKLRFQIYADEKQRAIKQVFHSATKLNEGLSAVRGVPLTRAHITYGGYYDAL
ncbi:hypothetical protein RJ641_026535 [Dillenia turbinata]|uniref:DUF6821 domain-containing protein n=1 Tax=Dillenia turbinata TaxID=194707 RepID=A0AAN8WF32_9MAGN